MYYTTIRISQYIQVEFIATWSTEQIDIIYYYVCVKFDNN